MSAIRNFWADPRGKAAFLLLAVVILLAGAMLLMRSGGEGPLHLTDSDLMALQQPHRAVYDLSLGRMKSGGEVQDITGRMVAEWRGGPACGGYSSEQRIVTRVIDAEGNLVSDDTRVTTFESIDGNEFHFDRSEYVNGELNKQESGVAKRDAERNLVILEKDGAKPVEFPGETIFPAQFNFRLIEAAEKGETTVNALLFDGTDDQASQASAFIGKPRDPAASTSKVPITNVQFGKPLNGKKAWPVRMSYFDDTLQDRLPSFQMGYMLFDNGISSELTLEYEQVTMKGTLVDIEYFKPGSC